MNLLLVYTDRLSPAGHSCGTYTYHVNFVRFENGSVQTWYPPYISGGEVQGKNLGQEISIISFKGAGRRTVFPMRRYTWLKILDKEILHACWKLKRYQFLTTCLISCASPPSEDVVPPLLQRKTKLKTYTKRNK